ncbi:MAG: TIGR03905 family TSCPD domain-containing protein [Clostridia bacterium]|nr:TIGR03905 family TSCPD domain-containing protein [Clostridia bacterium]
MIYTYTPRGVCSKKITLELKDGIIKSCKFEGGCDGNTSGICALIAGMRAVDAIDRLEGITCGYKDTSCPDQLAHALMDILQETDGQ